jgi:GNAT superfamily N-acetyltransferase
MTAFDQAWALVKMPLVPGSMKQRESNAVFDRNAPNRVWDADFQDPIDNEVRPLRVYEDEDGYNASIDGLSRVRVEPDEYNEDEYHVPDDDVFERLQTHPSMQRRGYATGLYDALAAILGNEGKNLVPSDVQSEEGQQFWGDKETWPVREDLE